MAPFLVESVNGSLASVSGITFDNITSNTTVVSRKRAHGRCTLHKAQTGGWADIRGINIV